MARPKKLRRVCFLPENNRFGPLGKGKNEKIYMTVEEFETIRLIDLENMTQVECAEQMEISRTTVQGIYIDARKKIADALVNGKVLVIEGGHYEIHKGKGRKCGKENSTGHRHRHGNK